MANLPTMKQLRYLVALGSTLNFTKAAQKCFVGQSTLSAGLKELEDGLGVQLVERDKHTVSMTPIGEEVIVRAKQLLAQADDLLEYVQSATDEMEGTIRLGVIPTIAPFMLPMILPKLRQHYPKLAIVLREDLTANLMDRLANHELDFAMIALPYDTSGFLVKEIKSDEFWLVGKSDDPLLKNKDIQLNSKMSDRLLLLEEGHCLREHTLQACKRKELANHEGIEATSLLTLIQMVEAGLGLALIPEIAIKSGILNQTTLLARPLAAPAPKRKIALVARQTTARIEAFNGIVKISSGRS